MYHLGQKHAQHQNLLQPLLVLFVETRFVSVPECQAVIIIFILINLNIVVKLLQAASIR